MNTMKKAAILGVGAALLTSLVATMVAPAAFASTSVTSAGTVLPGGISAAAASFTFRENSAASFPTSGGTLVVAITDYAGGSTVHFSGTPVLAAPSSLGASVTLDASGDFFTVTTTNADNFSVEQITVSGLRISADAGAASGAINASLSGSLVSSVNGGAFTATGTLQTAVSAAVTAGVLVNVTSTCGFATTGGSNSNVSFSDASDSRAVSGATALSGGQQTLTIGAGGSSHLIGATITQTVGNCNGSLLGSPGTVGYGTSSTQQLLFVTQPGGGAAGAVWTQQPVVEVVNASNQVVTTDTTTVVYLSIASNPAGGTLSCASGTSRTVVNGVASFYGCSINAGSASYYTLYATSNPYWTPATSSGFFIGVGLTPVSLTDAIAPGVDRGTSGFGTASVVVARGAYSTILGQTSPNLAGSIVQVWSKTKTSGWSLLTSRLVASDGTIHYYAKVNGWTAYWLKFAGDATHAPATSHGRIATNPA